MGIGIGPGKSELVDEQGVGPRPFVGGSGRILGHAFGGSGVRIKDLYLMNAINCYPMGAGDEPTDEQLGACQTRFREELAELEPRVIICFGTAPLRALLGFEGAKMGVKGWRGYLIQPDFDRWPWIPRTCEWITAALHPAYIMRGGSLEMEFLVRDCDRAVRVARGELAMHTVPSTNTPLPRRPPTRLGIDCETEGKGSSKITRVGLAWDSDTGIVGNSMPAWGFEFAQAVRLMTDPSSLKIIFNAFADVPWFRQAGIRIKGPLWDPMRAMHKICPDAPGYDLNSCASFFLDGVRWKHERVEDEERYNRRDGTELLMLQGVQESILRARGQLESFEHEMEVLWELLEMHCEGIGIDERERDRHVGRLNQREKWSYARWERETGEIVWRRTHKRTGAPIKKAIQEGGVLPSSHAQVKKLLYETWGLPEQIKIEREGGVRIEKVTVDQEALYNLLQLVPAGSSQWKALSAIYGCRHYGKLRETYTRVLDRIHPAFGPDRKDEEKGGKKFSGTAATGRLIAKGGEFFGKPTPAVGTMPKPLRSMIVPDPGHLLVAADWDSEELRIVAHRAGDPVLLDELERGVKIHAENAALFKCDRGCSKNVFYGWCYGSRGRGMVTALKKKGYHVHEKPGYSTGCRECTRLGELPSALEFCLALDAKYARVPRWHKELIAFVEEHGYIEDGFKHRRYFPDAYAAYNEIVNTSVQSSGAGMLKAVIIPIRRAAAAVGGRLILTNHDETVSSIPEQRVDEFVPVLKTIMEREFPEVAPGFTCPVEVKVGRSWYLKKQDLWIPRMVAA